MALYRNQRADYDRWVVCCAPRKPTIRWLDVRLLAYALLAYALWATGCVLGLLGAPATASALPTLRVQAGVRLQVRATAASGVPVTVEGTLSDDLGEPIAAQGLTIRVDGRARRVATTTDAGGHFSAEVDANLGDRVRVAVSGSAFYPAAEALARVSRVRAPVALAFVVPDRVLGLEQPDPVQLRIQADSDAGASALPLALSMEGQALARISTDATGHASFALQRSALPAGRIELRADFRGDRDRQPATAWATLLTRVEPQMSLAVERPPGRRIVRATARLRAGSTPLAGKPIGLFSGPTHLATQLTDARGVARFDVTDGSLPSGASHLEATFVSNEAALTNASSPPTAVPEPRPLPGASWPAVAFLVLALALATLASRWWRRHDDPEVDTTGEGTTQPPTFERANARALSRGSRLLSGRVVDRASRRALPGSATLRSEAGEALASVDCSPNGEFQLEAAVAGAYRLVVSAPGYRSEVTALKLPHRGQWHGANVHLLDLRSVAWQSAQALSALAQPAAEVAPTIREALQSLASRSTTASPSLAAVAARLEAVLYGSTPPDEGVVARLVSDAEQVLAQIHRSTPTPEVRPGAPHAHIVVDGKAGPSL